MNRIAQRRLFVRAVVAVFCLAVLICARRGSSGERPNIILMMADDLGWGDTGYNGHPVIKTPNLDQMSREGLRFDRFYAGSAVCSPTRGSCLTGRHPYRYGIPTANAGHLKAEEICLAEVLKAKGYATGHFGKWHLGTLSPDYSGKGPGRHPELHYSTPGMNGFDEWFSTEFAVATWDPYAPENSHLSKSMPWDPRALYWHNGKNVEGPLTGCDSKIIMDRALPFIERAAGEKTPFFAVIWFHAPHQPVVGGPEYRAMYKDRSENEQHYYAVVTAMDEQIGRLRNKLEELGVADDTMLWFCSDNGPEGNPGPSGRSQGTAGPFRGRKRSLYEGGVRVPGLLVWPEKVRNPRVVDVPCVTSDYFPTILAAVGLEMPQDRPYDGVNLMPLIEGKMTERPRPIAFQYGTQVSLTDNRFKLVHNLSKKRPRSDNGTCPFSEWELYDLANDPSETTNVAAKYPEIVARMRETLAEWQESCRRSAEGADYH
ncbi:sulfatase family protein [Thermostilla marina]